jgi:hypothetical protein
MWTMNTIWQNILTKIPTEKEFFVNDDDDDSYNRSGLDLMSSRSLKGNLGHAVA